MIGANTFLCGSEGLFSEKEKGEDTFIQAKRKYRFVSGAPGDEKKVHPGGRKNIFLIKKMMFDAQWSSKNIVLSYDKFKSDI